MIDEGFGERATFIAERATSTRVADESDPSPRRVPNAAFFAESSGNPPPASVPEDVFYAGPRPEPEPGLALRTARTPLRFGIVIFLVGWAGILFQASFLQQVVFGAPVFEELAKFGPALVVAALVGARSTWIRLPLAWASGAAFGVFEHFTTYPDEVVYMFVDRVAFHAGTTGLSMLFFGVFDAMPDVRARWASTALPTLLHWANNFGAVVLAFASAATPLALQGAVLWSTIVDRKSVV